MRTIRLLVRLATAAGAYFLCTYSQASAQSSTANYGAAMYSREAGNHLQPTLVVFPLHGTAFTITLPFSLDRIAFSPDGKALYGMAQDPSRSGLYRVDLSPAHATAVSGTEDLVPSFGLAISPRQDSAVISGEQVTASGRLCGIFELTMKTGAVARVAESEDCEYTETWHNLSVSSDGTRIIATRRQNLEIIDLATGRHKSFGQHYIGASWSHDGKWLMAVPNKRRGSTEIWDAYGRRLIRSVAFEAIDWSPDSRYLMGWKTNDRCGPYFGTLEVFEVQSGTMRVIQSSRCKVNQSGVGWVNVP